MLAILEQHHMPILLIVGSVLFIGGLGARLFQHLRVPQVVGYIVIGVLLGHSGLGYISDETIEKLRLFNFFALGIIGFMIGGELKLDIFKKYGKQLTIILLAEGLAAFFVVTLLVFTIAWMVSGEVVPSFALALVLGSISSATAPAATVDVLWEYKTRGPLTTMVFALVALDDGLALLLYGISASIAVSLLDIGSTHGGIGTALAHTAYELFGAVILGVAAGYILNLLVRLAKDHDKTLTFIIGTLGMVIGIALITKVDLILAAMGLGMTLVNLAPRRSRESFHIIERFAPPIYVLFFVIVGARLNIGEMSGWLWGLAAAFVLGRSGGKILGAFLGAKWSRASDSIRKYLGLCLFSQAGVAIGLAILAGERLTGENAMIAGISIGDIVVLTVTATTFIVQLVGPPCVKLAVTKAGEVGKNVTRQDLIKEYKVADIMDSDCISFDQGTSLPDILATIGSTDAMVYPVLNTDKKLMGIITIQSLKCTLSNSTISDWLVADDLMQPVTDFIEPETNLAEAMSRMEELDINSIFVISDDKTFDGMLERHAIQRKISGELLQRQKDVA